MARKLDTELVDREPVPMVNMAELVQHLLADVDRRFADLQMQVLSELGLRPTDIRHQTAAFVRTSAGDWTFVITETIPRK